MRSLFNIFWGTVLLVISSCQSPKIVQKISDAKKLEINKTQFIDKPLTTLLSQIKPAIKYVYGNPENRSSHVTGGTYLTFTFGSREEGRKRLSSGEKPIRVNIFFYLDPKNNRKPLPADGLHKWTKKETKEYGDMIIMRISVAGEN